MVLLAELARNLGDRDVRSIWATREARPWQKHELATLAAELGIADCTRIDVEGLDRTAIDGAALFVFVEEGHRAELEAVLPELAERAAILFVVDPWIAVTRGDLPPPDLVPPYAALICTSPALAAEGVYPAIDPELSASTAAVDPEHRQIREEVRAILRDPSGRPEQAARVKAFLGQPFTSWQHQNGRPGEVVTRAETLAGFARAIG